MPAPRAGDACAGLKVRSWRRQVALGAAQPLDSLRYRLNSRLHGREGDMMSDATPAVETGGAQKARVSPSADDPTGSPPIRKKSRWLWLALAALAAVAVIAVAWWALGAPDRQSPEYSLNQLTRAVKDGDWGGVQKYMDVDAVASRYVEAAFSSAMDGEPTDTASAHGGTGMGGGASGAASLEVMESTFVEQFREALQSSVEDGTLQIEEGGVASVLLGEAPAKLAGVAAEEASATVELPDGAGGTDDVVVVMKRAGDHWRIVALENIPDLLGSLR